MNLGGPVWHASAAALPEWPTDRDTLRYFACVALIGVGDPTLGEWDEWTGYAFHIRRRLSEREQAHVGPVRDIRGTPEALRRIAKVECYARLSPQGLRIMAEEAALPLGSDKAN